MAPTVRDRVRRVWRDGGPAARLVDLPGIGAYLAGRIARLVGDDTLASFVSHMRRLPRTAVREHLLRLLQNKRANQCVRTSPRATRPRYHAGDVNQRGYEALAALLDVSGAAPRLPARLPARSPAGKQCGCLLRDECNSSDVCLWNGRECLPRRTRGGFVAPSPHPPQYVRARTSAERRRVRRSAVTRRGSVVHDPDTLADVQAGHDATLRYVTHGDWLLRRPSSKVRLPVRRPSQG